MQTSVTHTIPPVASQPLWADIRTTTFARTLDQVCTAAEATLPASAARLARAAHLVLAGAVTMTAPTSAVVASQSQPLHGYVVNGACGCHDYQYAPENLCKHRLAMYLYIRVARLLAARTHAIPPAPVTVHCATCQVTAYAPHVCPQAVTTAAEPSLPEAPASVNCYIEVAGYKTQVTLRGHDEAEVLQRLHKLLAQYPLAK